MNNTMYNQYKNDLLYYVAYSLGARTPDEIKTQARSIFVDYSRSIYPF